MAQTFIDNEFGAIRVKRMHTTRHVRLRIGVDGALVATLPKRAPLQLVKELVDQSRDELREIVASNKQTHSRTYSNGERIGASHHLELLHGDTEQPHVDVRGLTIKVVLPYGTSEDSTMAQQAAKKGVAKALKKEALSYLPRRLSYLAGKYGFLYKSVRYSNAKGRWGSCSSNGTISLNIALMNLPMEIVDYILVHELCHTREMNHSQNFWSMVEAIVPDYKTKRSALKAFTPYL